MFQKNPHKMLSDRWKWNRNTKRKIYVSRKKTKNYWWIKISRIINKMEYQKTKNLLYNTTNQLSKFRAKTWNKWW